VTFSLDPIGGPAPGWSASAPLYVFLFAAVTAGIVIGGVADVAQAERLAARGRGSNGPMPSG